MRRRSVASLLAIAFMTSSGCSAIVDVDDLGMGSVSALAGADQVVAPEATVVLDASASTQSKGRALAYRWEQTSGPSVTLAVDGATATFTAPDRRASLEFTVYVTDHRHDEVADAVAVVVDSAPTIVAADSLDVMTVRTAYLDASKSFDPDDEPLSFRWSQIAGPTVVLDGDSTSIASFPTPADKATLVFRVSACDAVGRCATRDATVNVHKWVQVAAGQLQALALRSDGTVWAWGYDFKGSLGIGDRGIPTSNAPVRVESVANATAIWAGAFNTNFARANGVDVTWGRVCTGADGLTCSDYRTATPVDAAFQGARSFAASESVRWVVTSNGTLEGLGINQYGERGDCTIGASGSPTTIAGTWASSSFPSTGGATFAGGLTTTGALYVWGKNDTGQFGNNSTATSCATAYSPLANVTSFAFGGTHVAAVSGWGLYSWGGSESGGTGPYLTPTRHGSNFGWSRVAAGAGHTLALTTNGALHAWGGNYQGQLGLGDSNNRFPAASAEPPRVGTDSDWIGIAANGDSNGGVSFGLKSNGTLWSWGARGVVQGSGYIALSGDQTTPSRVVDGPARCGDGLSTSGYAESYGFAFSEACDDGPLNGSPGRCSANCACPHNRVVYVDASATGANDGTSWANAYSSIQSAVSAAGGCDTIWVARGTYTNGSASPAIPVLQMTPGARVYGGFAGYETHFAERAQTRNVTVLDGEDRVYHVAVGSSGGVLDGLTIRRGNAIGSGSNASAGGLLLDYENSSAFVVRNVIFEHNHAALNGGAIHATASTYKPFLFVDRCRFDSNSAVAGGAISISHWSLNLDDSTFFDNHALGAGATNRFGGGIYESSDGTLDVQNATFIANEAADAGSAIYGSSSQNVLWFISAVDNTGPGAVLHSSAQFGFGSMSFLALWDPVAGSEVNTLYRSNSCLAGASGTGNVSISTSPFEVVGSGPLARPYLTGASPCRDRAVADAASASNISHVWSYRTTVAAGALDTAPVDAGSHWAP